MDITQGCNFYCPSCHDSLLIPRNITICSLIPEEEFFEFLKHLGGQLDAVAISGD